MCHSELVRNLRPKVSKNAQGVKESKELMKECFVFSVFMHKE
jgi:hypothetical protein